MLIYTDRPDFKRSIVHMINLVKAQGELPAALEHCDYAGQALVENYQR
jgi:hypothetical protein